MLNATACTLFDSTKLCERLEEGTKDDSKEPSNLHRFMSNSTSRSVKDKESQTNKSQDVLLSVL